MSSLPRRILSANEYLSQRAFTPRAEQQSTRMWHAPRPTQFHQSMGQCGPECSGQMMAAFAPVDAAATQRPARLCNGRFEQAELAEQGPARVVQRQSARPVLERTVRLQASVDQHAEFARQMVVAQARFAHRRVAWTEHGRRRRDLRQPHHAFEQPRDFGARDAEVAMPALGFGNDEPRALQA